MDFGKSALPWWAWIKPPDRLIFVFFKKYWSYSDNLINFGKRKVWAFSGMFSRWIWTILDDFMIFWKKSLFWRYGKVCLYNVTQGSFLFLSVFFRFPTIFSDWCVVWSWFWYCCKELLLGNLLDTYKLMI